MARPKPNLPIYASMVACATATGIPRSVLSHAKRNNSAAFDPAGRVDLEKLLRWYFEGRGDGTAAVDWPLRLKKAQALTAELELEERQGRMVDAQETAQAWRTSAARIKAVLDAKLKGELPARLSGRPAGDIQKAIETALDAAAAEIQALPDRK